jgi:4,5-dihydroxyphthalate decarboxylase
MAAPVLRTVSRTQGNNSALKQGIVAPEGFTLEFEEVPVLVHAFRRMVRDLEFDVCEMALTTYLCAREHGVEFTAIPVFLVRAFHHGAIVHNINSGIESPGELQGTRIGVNRGYTVTTGVWARSILQDEYGIDLGKVTWVLSGDEHVEAYRPPENVVPMPDGETMEGLLASGNLSAAIGLKTDDENVRPLIPDALEAGIGAFRSRGHYPINHLVVIRNDVLEAHPGVAIAVFNAFRDSRDLYLERLGNGEIENPDAADKLHMRMLDLGAHPLPYGVEPNREVLENLIEHATTQKILRKPVDMESIFAPGFMEG